MRITAAVVHDVSLGLLILSAAQTAVWLLLGTAAPG